VLSLGSLFLGLLFVFVSFVSQAVLICLLFQSASQLLLFLPVSPGGRTRACQSLHRASGLLVLLFLFPGFLCQSVFLGLLPESTSQILSFLIVPVAATFLCSVRHFMPSLFTNHSAASLGWAGTIVWVTQISRPNHFQRGTANASALIRKANQGPPSEATGKRATSLIDSCDSTYRSAVKTSLTIHSCHDGFTPEDKPDVGVAQRVSA
jgi:hypothetical protein